jgi:hypothetical protein
MLTNHSKTTVPYRSQSELARAHPEIRSFKLVHHAPRGQTTDAQQAALTAKGITGTVYQVGDLFFQASMEGHKLTLPSDCTCLQYVGDNQNCPHHGRGATA